MQTIEIRHNNKRIIPMLILLTAALIAGNYFIFFSGKLNPTNTLIIINSISTIFLVYTIYVPAMKVIKKEPVITLTGDSIIIHERIKPVSFLWTQILDWKTEVEENTHYLVIRTADARKKVNLSWLDRKPAEIEDLIKTYSLHRTR